MKYLQLLFIFFFVQNYAFAERNVSGIISENTTFYKENSPYNLGKTYIPPGVTLTIEKGVTVNIKFNNTYNSGYSENQLYCEGVILANGTAGDSIIINGTIKIGYDRNMNYGEPKEPQATSVFNYCRINYINSTSIYTYDAPLIMNHCNVFGGVYIGMKEKQEPYQYSVINDCAISNNGSNNFSAHGGKLYLHHSTLYDRNDIQCPEAIIENNIFKLKQNTYHEHGLLVSCAVTKVHNNTFEGFGKSALRLYFTNKYSYTITKNIFKNNNVNMQFDLLYVDPNKLDEQICTTYKIEQNEFYNFGQSNIIVKDDNARTNKGKYVVRNLANNFWGNISEQELQASIIDNKQDFQVSIQFETSPYVLKNNYKKIVHPNKLPPPLFVFSDYDTSRLDAESFVEYVENDNLYHIPFFKKSDDEVKAHLNILNTYPNNNMYCIKKQDKLFINFFQTPVYYNNNNTWIGLWTLNFFNINLSDVNYPLKIKQAYKDAQTPYTSHVFTKGTTSNMNIETIITSFKNGYLKGTLLIKNASIDGSIQEQKASFQIKLTELPYQKG